MFEVRINSRRGREGIYYLIVLDGRNEMWYSKIRLIYRKKLTRLSIERLIAYGRLDRIDLIHIELLLTDTIIKYII